MVSGDSGISDFVISRNKLMSSSRVKGSMNFLKGINALSIASGSVSISSEYGMIDFSYISVNCGPIIAKVINRASPSSTWFGGVWPVPSACLVIERIIAIRGKQVTAIMREGKKTNALIMVEILSAANTSALPNSVLASVLIETSASETPDPGAAIHSVLYAMRQSNADAFNEIFVLIGL